MEVTYRDEAREEWNEARRKLFWSQMLNFINDKHTELLNFNDVSRRLHLRTAIYRGIQDVPLKKIVGSIGRYQDFRGEFLPINHEMRDRWQRIASLYLDPTSGGVPPIELYKVGDSYFVKDGNHRVSVANQLDMGTIEAHVWEYPAPLEGLDPDSADIDTLLLLAERRDFLEATNLDKLRPNHNIELTNPGGYTELLRQIAAYQDILEQIDGREVPYEEAVTAWYDMIYETTIDSINQEQVMKLFPDRTLADFFVWITRHQKNLEELYHKKVMMEDAAHDFKQQHHPNPLVRWWQVSKDWAQALFYRITQRAQENDVARQKDV
jgi:hypothetical protein